jgi:hypothetical protein
MSAQDTQASLREEAEEHPQSLEQQRAAEEAAKEAVSALDKAVQATEARVTPQLEEFMLEQRQAKLFAASGMFGLKKKTVNMAIAEAFTKIEIGKAMGFNAAQSMMGISVISDRPVIESRLLASRMQELGYDWLVDDIRDKNGVCTCIRLWLFYKTKPVMKRMVDEHGAFIPDDDGKPLMEQVSVSFGKKDADRIKMWEWDDAAKRKVQKPLSSRDTYVNTPDDMYYARAIGKLQKRYVPKALAGGVILREEIDDAVDEPLPVPQAAPGSYFPTGSAELARAAGERKLREEFGVDPNGSPTSAPADKTESKGEAQKPSPGKPAGPAKPKFF